MSHQYDPKPSVTYKLKFPDDISPHAMYFTVAKNWLFINSKEMENFQWMTALMVSYSERLSNDEPIENIIKELMECSQPNGWYIIPGTTKKANSVLHHLGILLEKYNNENV